MDSRKSACHICDIQKVFVPAGYECYQRTRENDK